MRKLRIFFNAKLASRHVLTFPSFQRANDIPEVGVDWDSEDGTGPSSRQPPTVQRNSMATGCKVKSEVFNLGNDVKNSVSTMLLSGLSVSATADRWQEAKVGW